MNINPLSPASLQHSPIEASIHQSLEGSKLMLSFNPLKSIPEIRPYDEERRARIFINEHSLEDITHLDEELSEEIPRQRREIENDLWFLQNVISTERATITILDAQNWGFQALNVMNDFAKEGTAFLKKVYPSFFLREFAGFYHISNLDNLTLFSSLLLGAINSGCNGLALICREKVLEESRSILEQLKKNYPKDETSADGNHETVHQQLADWEKGLELEERALASMKNEFAIDLGTKAISIVSLPLAFPTKDIMKVMSPQAINLTLTGLSYAGGGLSLILSGLAYKNAAYTDTLVTDWSQNYIEWVKKNQPTYDVSFNHLKQRVSERKDKTEDLWEMRVKIAGNKILTVKSKINTYDDKIKKFTKEQLKKDEHTQHLADDPVAFETWFAEQNIDKMIASYIDHQETIENTTKNALKQMVSEKHEIEGRFTGFNKTLSTVNLVFATITLITSVALGILGLLTIPVGGAGLLLLGISVASTLCAFSSLGLSYLFSRKEKPNLTKTLSFYFLIRSAVLRLRSAITTYQHQLKERKILKISSTIIELIKTGQEDTRAHRDAIADYQKFKKEFEESHLEVKKWKAKVETLDKQIADASWQDVALQSHLKINSDSEQFDSLRAFQEAFEQCDLELLSDETKNLLQTHLGINLNSLQFNIKNNPVMIQEMLKNFFNMNSNDLVTFIRNQKLRQT